MPRVPPTVAADSNVIFLILSYFWRFDPTCSVVFRKMHFVLLVPLKKVSFRGWVTCLLCFLRGTIVNRTYGIDKNLYV